MKPEAAANFYRAALRPPQWRLISDSKDNQGATLLYAERDGRPIWVRVYPDSEFNATFIEMTGAVANALNSPSVTADEAPKLRPFVALAEKLGAFAGQPLANGLTKPLAAAGHNRTFAGE